MNNLSVRDFLQRVGQRAQVQPTSDTTTTRENLTNRVCQRAENILGTQLAKRYPAFNDVENLTDQEIDTLITTSIIAASRYERIWSLAEELLSRMQESPERLRATETRAAS